MLHAAGIAPAISLPSHPVHNLHLLLHTVLPPQSPSIRTIAAFRRAAIWRRHLLAQRPVTFRSEEKKAHRINGGKSSGCLIFVCSKSVCATDVRNENSGIKWLAPKYYNAKAKAQLLLQVTNAEKYAASILCRI